jgi:EAL domain-containing protein (putative c-di-GMP-specific phosphodiesterase class I)
MSPSRSAGTRGHAGDLVWEVEALLTEYRLPPELLEPKLTETIAFSNCQTAGNTGEALHSGGISVALDDFDFASLDLFKKLTFSRRKNRQKLRR